MTTADEILTALNDPHPAITAAMAALRAPHVTVYADGEIGDTPERIAAAVVPAVLEWAAEYITHHHINLTGYAISEHMDAWAREIAGSGIAAPSDTGRRCDALCRDVKADRDRLLAERDEARRLASMRADVIARYRKTVRDARALLDGIARDGSNNRPTIAAAASTGDAGTSGHPQPSTDDLGPPTDAEVADLIAASRECRSQSGPPSSALLPAPPRTETPMPDPTGCAFCALMPGLKSPCPIHGDQTTDTPLAKVVEAAEAAFRREFVVADNPEAATALRRALVAATPILLAAGRKQAAEALHLLPGSHVWALVTGEPVGRAEGETDVDGAA